MLRAIDQRGLALNEEQALLVLKTLKHYAKKRRPPPKKGDGPAAPTARPSKQVPSDSEQQKEPAVSIAAPPDDGSVSDTSARSITDPFFKRVAPSINTATDAAAPLTPAEREAWRKAEPELERRERQRAERERDRALAIELLGGGDMAENPYLVKMRAKVQQGEHLSNGMVGAVLDVFRGDTTRLQQAAEIRVCRANGGKIPRDIANAREIVRCFTGSNSYLCDLKRQYDKAQGAWYPTPAQAAAVLRIKHEGRAR